MTYTIWSHGRLLGETSLGYARWDQKLRAGDFFPSELGETLMPIVTGVSPACRQMGLACRRLVANANDSPDTQRAQLHEDADYRTARADFDAAVDRRDALDLELRGPDGAVIPTATIFIQDTEYLLSLDDTDLDEEFDYDDFSYDADPNDLDPAMMAAADADYALWCSWQDERLAELEALGVEQEGWTDDGVEAEFPRYQIHVTLLHATAIP